VEKTFESMQPPSASSGSNFTKSFSNFSAWQTQRTAEHFTTNLVGGIPTHLKNMKVSWDDEIPNIWKNKIHVPNHQPEMVVWK